MYIEGARERALVPLTSDLGFKEREIRKKRKKGEKRKKIKVRIGPSRIVGLVLSVPPSLPKVF